MVILFTFVWETWFAQKDLFRILAGVNEEAMDHFGNQTQNFHNATMHFAFNPVLARYAQHARNSVVMACEYADIISKKPPIEQSWQTEFLLFMQNSAWCDVVDSYERFAEEKNFLLVDEKRILEAGVGTLAGFSPLDNLEDNPLDVFQRHIQTGTKKRWVISDLIQKKTGEIHFCTWMFFTQESHNNRAFASFKKKSKSEQIKCYGYIFAINPCGHVDELNLAVNDIAAQTSDLKMEKAKTQKEKYLANKERH